MSETSVLKEEIQKLIHVWGSDERIHIQGVIVADALRRAIELQEFVEMWMGRDDR